MKKMGLTIVCVIIVSIFLPINAQADAGPKPSVVIDFKGLDGELYFATLLSSTKSTGPFSAFDENNPYSSHYKDGQDEFQIYQRFVNYEDNDGFYFLQFFEDCSETNRFSWTYYPPQEFKVLLYFPESDAFIASEIYERYAFDSYFSAEIAEQSDSLALQKEITLSKTYNYTKEIVSLVIRIILTIAIELGIAWLFGLRGKRVFKFISVTNIITQIALNLALNIINFYMGMFAFVFFYILLEIAVIVAESLLYAICLKNDASKPKLILYAVSANVVSFASGMFMAIWIPGIF